MVFVAIGYCLLASLAHPSVVELWGVEGNANDITDTNSLVGQLVVPLQQSHPPGAGGSVVGAGQRGEGLAGTDDVAEGHRNFEALARPRGLRFQTVQGLEVPGAARPRQMHLGEGSGRQRSKCMGK